LHLRQGQTIGRYPLITLSFNINVNIPVSKELIGEIQTLVLGIKWF